MQLGHTNFVDSKYLTTSPGYSTNPYDVRDRSPKAYKFFKNPYVRVPNALIRGTDIIPDPYIKTTFLTIAALWACAGLGKFLINRYRLQRYLGFHQDTISKHLSFLRARGLIVTKKTPSGYLEMDVPILRLRTEELPKEYSESDDHGHYVTSIPLSYILNFLPATPKLLLIIIKSLSIGYNRKEVYFSMKQFEEYSSFSRRTISRYLKLLKSMETVEVKHRRLQWNHYVISCDKLAVQFNPDIREEEREEEAQRAAMRAHIAFFKKWG